MKFYSGITAMLAATLASVSTTQIAVANESVTLSNPQASIATIALYNQLLKLENKTENRLLSGLFGGYSDIDRTDYGRYNADNEVVENRSGQKVDDNEMVRIEKITGKRPVIYACDFGLGWMAYKNASDAIATGCVDDLILKAKQGHLVQISNHLISPIYTFEDNFKTAITNQQYAKIFEDGTIERQRWLDIMNEVAKGLDKFKQADIPVLFRPLHEMNGDWFWWGADNNRGGTTERQQLFKRLFADMHHYLSEVQGLNNLIWIYSADYSRPELVEYYPGDNYVDIVGIDAYFENLQEINQLKNAYTTMIKAFNKPYALTETGPRANWNPNGEWRPKQPFDYEYLIQTIAKDMPKTVFFLTWNTGFGPAWNLKAQQTYTHPWVATLGEF